jgi:hypothetical protein
MALIERKNSAYSQSSSLQISAISRHGKAIIADHYIW